MSILIRPAHLAEVVGPTTLRHSDAGCFLCTRLGLATHIALCDAPWELWCFSLQNHSSKCWQMKVLVTIYPGDCCGAKCSVAECLAGAQ